MFFIDQKALLYYNIYGDFMKKYGIWAIIIVIMVVFYFVFKLSSNRHLLFIVSDDSKNCNSYNLYVYDNNTYGVDTNFSLSGTKENNGKYEMDANTIINNIHSYNCDETSVLNYQVTLSNGDEYCISMSEKNEFTDFINSIVSDKLFTCE